MTPTIETAPTAQVRGEEGNINQDKRYTNDIKIIISTIQDCEGNIYRPRQYVPIFTSHVAKGYSDHRRSLTCKCRARFI